jgi:hypothetical protein
MEQIQSQEQWVLHRLEKFYAIPENLKKAEQVLSGKSPLSLRLIDWFVTNYAKKYNSAFVSKKKHIIVYLSYKSHLKAYSKKMFDPFCRCKRIKFNGLDTTVGQLNFFEWIISDDILDYIQENKDKIHADMETRMHERDGSRRRHELSNSATNTISKHDVTVKVSFD